MTFLPFDPQHPPTDKEYQYYADLFLWEQDDPRINAGDTDKLTTEARKAFLSAAIRRGRSGGSGGSTGIATAERPF